MTTMEPVDSSTSSEVGEVLHVTEEMDWLPPKKSVFGGRNDDDHDNSASRSCWSCGFCMPSKVSRGRFLAVNDGDTCVHG